MRFLVVVRRRFKGDEYLGFGYMFAKVKLDGVISSYEVGSSSVGGCIVMCSFEGFVSCSCGVGGIDVSCWMRKVEVRKGHCARVLGLNWFWRLTVVSLLFRLVLGFILDTFKIQNLNAAPHFMGPHSMLLESCFVTLDACVQYTRSFNQDRSFVSLPLLFLSPNFCRFVREHLSGKQPNVTTIFYKGISTTIGLGTITPQRWCKQGSYNNQGPTREEPPTYMPIRIIIVVVCFVMCVMVYKDLVL
nr:uncharacterized protein LOC110791737 [Spinacia oleracea]